MKHKELLLILRLPVPLKVLNIYQVFEEDEDALHQFLSETTTDFLNDRLTFFTALEDLQQRAILVGQSGEAVKDCFEFLTQFVEKEVFALFPGFGVKRLQAVHFTAPSTVIVTFFATEKDSLYAELYPRS